MPENEYAYSVYVFSTLVEVFLKRKSSVSTSIRLLHARGGVSKAKKLGINVYTSSPRSWRCFSTQATLPKYGLVFSTLVEVFPPDHVQR